MYSIALLTSSTIMATSKLRCPFCSFTATSTFTLSRHLSNWWFSKKQWQPSTPMKRYNALSSVQHSSAAEKYKMDSTINFLAQICDEFVYPPSENNISIIKSVEMSHENAIWRQMDYVLYFLAWNTGIHMANQLIGLFHHHHFNLWLFREKLWNFSVAERPQLWICRTPFIPIGLKGHSSTPLSMI